MVIAVDRNLTSLFLSSRPVVVADAGQDGLDDPGSVGKHLPPAHLQKLPDPVDGHQLHSDEAHLRVQDQKVDHLVHLGGTGIGPNIAQKRLQHTIRAGMDVGPIVSKVLEERIDKVREVLDKVALRVVLHDYGPAEVETASERVLGVESGLYFVHQGGRVQLGAAQSNVLNKEKAARHTTDS